MTVPKPPLRRSGWASQNPVSCLPIGSTDPSASLKSALSVSIGEFELLTRIHLKITESDWGASMVEYALLVVLIALVALVAVEVAGSEVSNSYSDIQSNLEWANSK